jgi:very-short-patch-repair endonuclease
MSEGGGVDAVDALIRLGGIARARDIIGLSSRRGLRRAVEAGDIARIGPGRYAFGVSHAEARALDGAVSHLSAAMHWGWQVKWPPDRPWVTVARSRNISTARREAVHLVYADIGDDVIDGVTAPVRTVIDCARRLPFDEALAVADSALRAGDVTQADLKAASATLKGRGAAHSRMVASSATPRAANPFESVLRAIALEFPLDLTPQTPVVVGGQTYVPDLVDTTRKLVLEADSWRFHASQQGHARDCRRYNALALGGWLVLRFTWDQVMHSPDYVRQVLAEAVSASRRLGRATA